ncbi:MAG: ABC transporter permease subunit [Candidatus Eremiobacteraeota bacterium]|nr:ABC transporter permease subunit [Candidatus Eremiobacteraeota bacterium]MBV8354584.1 ABC transporter permease subunit [Candidatus Eremiobacteraeota bacterium]
MSGPLDLSPHYLRALLVPMGQTVGMACAGVLLALALGVPAAIVVATRAPGHRVLSRTLAALRAIPDLTLAILAVVLLGLGPAAGIAALVVFYAAMIGKVYGEILETAPAAPIDALRATGAGRVAVAAFGLIPTTLNDLLSFGTYAFECAMRASIIIGAVGAGGIGTELIGAINALDYPRAATLILALIVLVTLVDGLGAAIRRHPRLALVIVPIGLGTLWLDRPQFFALTHAVWTFSRMLPPQLDATALARLPMLLAQTLAIAVFGTALGAVIGFLSAFFAARTIVPIAVVLATRRILDAARAIPEVLWGLILVVSVGVGPLAGILALGLHSGGVLGKLYAESFENVAAAPVTALVATGASKGATAAYAIVPLALGPLAVHTLFRLEWNMRAAAVVGMIGAGGIGQALFEAQQLFFYKTMAAYVLLTWFLVLASDALGERLRRRTSPA